MALPQLDSSKFDLTLPVSGKKIKFRPFLVKEQKVILQAIEMGDKSQLLNALHDALTSCTFGEKVDEFPVADVEYLTLNLRAKSSGEMLDLRYRCRNLIPEGEADNEEGQKITVPEHECDTSIPLKLNLSEVPMDAPKQDFKIMFSESVGVMMKNISYGDWKLLQQMESPVERGIATLVYSVDYVFSADEIFKRPDFTDVELADWLGGLNEHDLGKVEDFIKAAPKLRKKLIIKCPSCGHEEEVKLEGLDDFLE
jgi:hypothetical protein